MVQMGVAGWLVGIWGPNEDYCKEGDIPWVPLASLPGRFVILSVVLFGLVYNPNETCSLNLVDHGRGYLGILLSCMIAELAIIWLSMRGSILYTEPRDSMQYVLYVRLGKQPEPPRFPVLLFPGASPPCPVWLLQHSQMAAGMCRASR